jgi:hypothetical protein
LQEDIEQPSVLAKGLFGSEIISILEYLYTHILDFNPPLEVDREYLSILVCEEYLPIYSKSKQALNIQPSFSNLDVFIERKKKPQPDGSSTSQHETRILQQRRGSALQWTSYIRQIKFHIGKSLE